MTHLVNPVPYLTLSPLLTQLNSIRENLTKLRTKIQSSKNLQNSSQLFHTPVSLETKRKENEKMKLSNNNKQILNFILQLSMKTQQNQPSNISEEIMSRTESKNGTDDILENILQMMTPSVTENIVKNCDIKIYELQRKQESLQKEIKQKKSLLQNTLRQNRELLNKIQQLGQKKKSAKAQGVDEKARQISQDQNEKENERERKKEQQQRKQQQRKGEGEGEVEVEVEREGEVEGEGEGEREREQEGQECKNEKWLNNSIYQ